jgi:hypothetical protein
LVSSGQNRPRAIKITPKTISQRDIPKDIIVCGYLSSTNYEPPLESYKGELAQGAMTTIKNYRCNTLALTVAIKVGARFRLIAR